MECLIKFTFQVKRFTYGIMLGKIFFPRCETIYTNRGCIMDRNTTIAIVTVIVCLTVLFVSIFIWPTPYVYEKVTYGKTQQIFRINRLTGESEKIIPDERKSIKLCSTAFGNGEDIPIRHAAIEGPGLLPYMYWSDLPKDTKELALICENPNAERRPTVHWVIYKIPANATRLPEGIPQERRLKEPPGALQGVNSFNTIGYYGPFWDTWSHRIIGTLHFKIYALDASLTVEPGLDKYQLLEKMQGQIIGEGQLIGK